jgi:hypothetical protein
LRPLYGEGSAPARWAKTLADWLTTPESQGGPGLVRGKNEATLSVSSSSTRSASGRGRGQVRSGQVRSGQVRSGYGLLVKCRARSLFERS